MCIYIYVDYVSIVSVFVVLQVRMTVTITTFSLPPASTSHM